MTTTLATRLRRSAVAAALVLVAACAPKQPPIPVWQRPDVGPESAREVELDCRQRAIAATATANDPVAAQRVHEQREDYVDRCMRGSGFTRR